MLDNNFIYIVITILVHVFSRFYILFQIITISVHVYPPLSTLTYKTTWISNMFLIIDHYKVWLKSRLCDYKSSFSWIQDRLVCNANTCNLPDGWICNCNEGNFTIWICSLLFICSFGLVTLFSFVFLKLFFKYWMKKLVFKNTNYTKTTINHI